RLFEEKQPAMRYDVQEAGLHLSLPGVQTGIERAVAAVPPGAAQKGGWGGPGRSLRVGPRTAAAGVVLDGPGVTTWLVAREDGGTGPVTQEALWERPVPLRQMICRHELF